MMYLIGIAITIISTCIRRVLVRTLLTILTLTALAGTSTIIVSVFSGITGIENGCNRGLFLMFRRFCMISFLLIVRSRSSRFRIRILLRCSIRLSYRCFSRSSFCISRSKMCTYLALYIIIDGAGRGLNFNLQTLFQIFQNDCAFNIQFLSNIIYSRFCPPVPPSFLYRSSVVLCL